MSATPSHGSERAPASARDLAELYADNARFVWRNLRRLGVAADGVEDAVQDVFLVACQRLGEFEGRSSLRTWLFSIMLRVASRRRQQRRRLQSRFATAPPDFLDGLEGDGQTGPLDLLVRQRAATLLLELLDLLDLEKRTLVVMVELEQMSVVEAAVALEINVNTAHSRLRAARRLLAEHLKRATEREGSGPESS